MAPSNDTTLLEVARGHPEQPMPTSVHDLSWRERFLRLTGVDRRVCSRCSEHSVERVAHLAPQRPGLDTVEALDSTSRKSVGSGFRAGPGCDIPHSLPPRFARRPRTT